MTRTIVKDEISFILQLHQPENAKVIANYT